MNKLILLCLLPINLLGQVDRNDLVSSEQIAMDEIALEAHYSSPVSSNNISIFPHILKKNQEFVLDFNYSEKDPFEIEVRDSEGSVIEMIYSSQLSIFEAKNSITLQIHTPLESGQYYIVLNSKNVKLGTKMIKFDGN